MKKWKQNIVNRVFEDKGKPQKIGKTTITRLIEATFTAIEYELKLGNSVTIMGFGTFVVRKIKAHKAWVGAYVDIPEHKRVGFIQSRGLKRSLNAKQSAS